MNTLILDPSPRSVDSIFSSADLKRLKDVVNVVWGKDRPMPPGLLREEIARAKYIVSGTCRNIAVTDEGAPQLQAILEVAGGHPSPQLLDYQTCFRRGIRVLSCAPAFSPHVAEMALGMVLSLSRKIAATDRDFRHHREIYSLEGNEGSFSLFGKNIGFVGFGNIALHLKTFLDPFGCRYMAYDPWLPDVRLKRHGVTPATLREVMSETKVVFVLAKATKYNREMVSRELLQQLSPDAVFVLISRAHVVDFEAMVDLLQEKRFSAAVDVFPEEPFPGDHRLRDLENVVLTSHLAGPVPEGMLRIGRMVTDDVEAMEAGLPPGEMQVGQPEFVFQRE